MQREPPRRQEKQYGWTPKNEEIQLEIPMLLLRNFEDFGQVQISNEISRLNQHI